MQVNPIGLDVNVQRLVSEHYTVIIDDGFLIIENVPYISAPNTISRGALICAYREVDGVAHMDGDHTVYFTGTVPCQADGTSLELALVADKSPTTVAGRQALCRLSNKPDPIGDMLTNYHTKMTHYIRKLTSHARAIDTTISATSEGSFHSRIEPSVFHYPNGAIARAGLEAYDRKLHLKKVAIIGLGGTGSYILDALAKTAVAEIHLYDGDTIEPHNAFRLPGALTIEQAHSDLQKTDYLASEYSSFRVGVFSHPVKIDDTNIQELDDCEFVFIAIDHGPSRGLISEYLLTKGIPFIDVGIGVDKISEATKLHARTRTSLVTENHRTAKLPVTDDIAEAVYNNIQLVELNAINAMMAIIRYKQYLGFYTDEVDTHELKYKVSLNRMITSGSTSES